MKYLFLLLIISGLAFSTTGDTGEKGNGDTTPKGPTGRVLSK